MSLSVINYARTYSGMQRDQRPQPREVEAAVSVQTMNLLRSVFMIMIMLYETTYGLCISSVPSHACSALVSRKRRALGAVVSRNRNICSEFLLNVITYCVLINYLRRPGNVAGDFPRPRYFGVTYALSILVPCGFSY